MFKGSIYLVQDINLAIQCGSQGSKVIYIGEFNNNIPPQFINCPILLPPYEALNAEINGDMNSYIATYSQYLSNNKECYDTFMTIITALFNDTNIIVYVEEGNNLQHANILMQYMSNMFNIQIGTDTIPSVINPDYIPILIALIYDFIEGIITADTVLLFNQSFDNIINIPMIYMYAGYLLDKLIKDTKCKDLNELRAYYDNLHLFQNKTNPYIINLVIKEA